MTQPNPVGSVPDFLTKILPFDPISLLALFMAFLHLNLFIILLSLTLTFSKI